MSKVSLSYNTVNRTREINKGLKGKIKLGDEKNTGSLGQYLGGNFLAGAGGVVEGVADLAVGSIYSLTGRNQLAKSLFANNITNRTREELAEAYNPGALASFGGDVATGLGQTSLAMLGSLALGPSAGMIPIAAGAAGGGISQAVQKTGELGFKEYGYGLTVGALEGLLERYLGAVGANSSKVLSGGVTNTAVGATFDKLSALVAKNAVVKGILSSSLEEGLEEAVSAIGGTALEKAWQIDPEAKVEWGEVMYSALVGALTGGVLGGATSALTVARNEVRGKAIREGGKEQTILATADDVAERLTRMAGAKRSEDAVRYAKEITRLKTEYDALSPEFKAGKRGAQLLGALESAMIYSEMGVTMELQRREIVESLSDAAQAEAYLGYARALSGDSSLTVEDIRSNKNGILDNLSISAWARDYVTPSEALTNAVEIDRLVRENAGLDPMAETEDADLGGLADGAYRVYRGAAEGKPSRIVMREGEGYVVADITKDAESGENTRYEAARRFKSAEEASSYLRGEIKEAPTVEAAEASHEGGKKAEEKAPPAAKKVADEESAARKHIKDFDKLSSARRRAVLTFEKQAKTAGLDAATTNAIARIVANRSGLQVVLDERLPTNLNGFWDGSLSGGNRVIVLRPQDPKAVSNVFLHEMVHDMAKAQPQAYARLGKEALKLATEDFAKNVEDTYSKYYADTKGRAPTKEELTEETVAHVIQSRIDQTAFAKRFAGNRAIQRGGQFLRRLVAKLKKNDAAGKEIVEGERLLSKFDEALRQYSEGAKVLERVGVTEKAMTEAVVGKEKGSKAFVVILEDGKVYVEASRKVINGSTRAEQRKEITQFFSDLLKDNPSLEIQTIDGDVLTITKAETANKARDDYRYENGKRIKLTDGEFAVKLNVEAHIDEVAEVSVPNGQKGDSKNHDFANDGFTYRKAYFKDFDGQYYEVTLSIGNNGTVATVYNVGKTKESVPPSAKVIAVVGSKPRGGTLSEDSIAQNPEKSTPSGEKNSKASINLETYGKSAQDKETIAKYSKDRYYTKADAEQVLNDIFVDVLPGDMDTYYEWSNRDRSVATAALWKMLNARDEGERGGIALDLADFIIKKSLVRSVSEDDAFDFYTTQADILGNYRRKFDLSSIKDEIVARYGKDRLRSIWSRWAANKNSEAKYTPDQIVDELIERGVQIDRDASPADIFFAIVDQYDDAVGSIRAYEDITLDRALSAKEYNGLKRDIATEILNAYDKYGAESVAKQNREQAASVLESQRKDFEQRLDSLQKKYRERLEETQMDLRSAVKERRVHYRVWNLARDIQNFYRGREKFAADILQDPKTRALAEATGSIFSRGRIKGIRVKEVARLLSDLVENQIGVVTRDSEGNLKWTIGGETVTEGIPTVIAVASEQYFTEDVRDRLKVLQEIDSDDLRVDQLENLVVMLSVLKRFLNDTGTYTNPMTGKRVGVLDRAREGIAQLEKASKLAKSGKFANVGRMVKWIMSGYLDPKSVFSLMDGFMPGGVLSEMFEITRRGEEAAKDRSERMLEGLREFMHSNRGYENRLNEGGIYLNGKEIPRGAAIEIYELSKREQARLALEESSIIVPKLGEAKKDGRRRVVSGTETVTIREGNLDAAASELYSQFDATDRAFIEQIEAFYKVSTEVKTGADMAIHGYTNAISGHYYPIHRDRMTIATRVTNARVVGQEIFSVYNAPFNKNTKPGARNAIHVNNPYTEAQMHASVLSVYENLYEPLLAFDMVYNANVGSTTDVQTVRKLVNRETADLAPDGLFADKYISKFMADLQHGGKALPDDSFFDAIMNRLRGSFAVYALGFNFGTVLKQTSSYASAFNVLSFKAMARGLATKPDYEEMDKYSRITYARAADNGLTKAETLTDQLGTLQKISTLGIEKMDRAVLARIWNACLEQVELDGMSKTSEEGKKRAGELLDEVIRNTQSNSFVSGRSSMMRGNELVKAFTMFTGEQVKQASRVWERAATVYAYAQYKKNGIDIGVTEAQYEEAKTGLAKSIAALLASTAIFVAIGQAMKTLFRQKRRDKDGEEISAVLDASYDMTSNLLGLIPLGGEFFDYFVRGYEMGDNFFGNALTVTAESVNDMGDLMVKLASGKPLEAHEIGSPVRKMLYAISQVTGIPLRNIYNTFDGVVSLVSAPAGYKLDSLFYRPAYTEDFKKAVAEGDERMARFLAGEILKNGYGKAASEEVKELLRLYEAGFDGVIPSVVSSKVSVNGEIVQMTEKQYKEYLAITQMASDAVSKVMSSGMFKTLDDATKEKVIKGLYAAYKQKAKTEVLGAAQNRLIALSSLADLDLLSAYGSVGKAFESDEEGVSGGKSKSQKIKAFLKSLGYTESDDEYYLMLMASGITSEKIRERVAKVIRSSSLSEDEKRSTAETLGIETSK